MAGRVYYFEKEISGLYCATIVQYAINCNSFCINRGLAVFEFELAWGIVEVPALEIAPYSRRSEVYGTSGACTIPHLGSGHLANKNVQLVETFRSGQSDWQRLETPARTLQISDLREFAAVVTRKKQPDYSAEHDLAVQETLLRASGMMPAQCMLSPTLSHATSPLAARRDR